MLEKDDWRQRQGAAEALGRIGDAGGVEPLVTLLEDESDWVRETAAMTTTAAQHRGVESVSDGANPEA